MEIHRITNYDKEGRILSREHFATPKEASNRMLERKHYRRRDIIQDIITKPWELNSQWNYIETDNLRLILKRKEDTIKQAIGLLKNS